MKAEVRRLKVVLFSVVMVAAAAGAEVIDRVLAVVNGAMVTQSDVYGAMAFGLVHTVGARDPVGSALEQLIERALVLVEVERYAPPEPAEQDLAARIAGIRQRFRSPEDFDRAMRASGFTEERLRAIARDEIRRETYLNQRFGATAQPTDEDVARYYRAHPQDYVRGGAPRPLAEVENEVRARLIAERSATLIADWVAGLRRRADVTVQYLPAPR
jgi:parvulin-like peptidyl-prolyl isomerase